MNAIQLFLLSGFAVASVSVEANQHRAKGRDPRPEECQSLLRNVDDRYENPLPWQLEEYQLRLIGPRIREPLPPLPLAETRPAKRERKPASAFDLSIPRTQVREFLTSGNTEMLSDTLFLIPSNDGEAQRAIDILKAVKAPMLAPMYVQWGSKLDEHYANGRHFLDSVYYRYGVDHKAAKRIVLFELPAPKLEASLRKLGYELIIIDHHNYAELETDRYRPESSLEQIMELIGWKPSRADMAIAINDRGYIAGLRDFGLNDDEIREVRLNDHLGQGKSRSQILFDRERVDSFLPHVRQINGFYVLETMNREIDSALLKEEINIRNHGVVNIFEFSSKRIGFSGSPAVIRALKAIDFEALGYHVQDVVVYGGGSETASMFFGFKPKTPPRGAGELLPYYVKAHFLEVAERAAFPTDWGF